MIFTKKDAFWGGILLAFSDSFASVLIDQFSISRFLGMVLIGATIYTLETVNFFHWVEKFSLQHLHGFKKKAFKTIAIILFFNPIWIFRHYIFIDIFSGNIESIGFNLLHSATISFFVNIPISIIINYLIQNEIALKWRYVASSAISAIMVIYYALSKIWFE